MHQNENLNNAVPSGGRSLKRGTANKRHHFSAIEEVRADYCRECVGVA